MAPRCGGEHKVHVNTAIVVVWQDQVYTTETYEDVLPLDGAELVVLHLVLVLQGTVKTPCPWRRAYNSRGIITAP